MTILYIHIKIKYVIGYITVKGGHRIGISGNTVIKDGQVINISHIYSLNFRIARQVVGCSNNLLTKIINKKENSIHSCLIISPPGRGKTTILKDLIRSLSLGIEELGFYGVNVGVVDERGEIAAMYKGQVQNDLGSKVDVLDGLAKDIGMKMLIRSMNPKVIVADEIGSKEDVEAIKYAVCSGVKGIFTAHGASIEDVKNNPILKTLILENLIDKIFVIDENREAILENVA